MMAFATETAGITGASDVWAARLKPLSALEQSSLVSHLSPLSQSLLSGTVKGVTLHSSLRHFWMCGAFPDTQEQGCSSGSLVSTRITTCALKKKKKAESSRGVCSKSVAMSLCF